MSIILNKDGVIYNILIYNDNLNINDGTEFHNADIDVSPGQLNDIKEELITYLNKTKQYVFGLNIQLNDPGTNGIIIENGVIFNNGIYYINKIATNIYDKYGEIKLEFKPYAYKKHQLEYNKIIEEQKKDIENGIHQQWNNTQDEINLFYTKLDSFYLKLKVFFIILLLVLICIIVYFLNKKYHFITKTDI